MAKKDLSSLVNGIMGTDNKEEQSGSTVNKTDSSSSGRPKKISDSDMMVTSLRVNKKTIRKLKMIAAADDLNLQTVIAAAFEMYIKKWESENGNPINI